MTLLASCSSEGDSALKIDSAHALALDGAIEEGYLILTEPVDSEDQVRMKIRSQMRYSIGQLNGEGGVGELIDLQITLGAQENLGPGTQKILYSATFTVAWPRVYMLYLPKKSDISGFYWTLGHCHEPNAAGVESWNLWYYYRPQVCSEQIAASEHGADIPLTLAVSPQNSTGKYPEYDQVWKDGRLVATLIFGREKSEVGVKDEGVLAYDTAFRLLRDHFGPPVRINIPLDAEEPSKISPEVHMEFATSKGPVDIAMFLTGKHLDSSLAF